MPAASVPPKSGEQTTSFIIQVPSLEEQTRIAKHVDDELAKRMELEDQPQRAIALFAERRSALATAAVTGQIDVRGAEACSV